MTVVLTLSREELATLMGEADERCTTVQEVVRDAVFGNGSEDHISKLVAGAARSYSKAHPGVIADASAFGGIGKRAAGEVRATVRRRIAGLLSGHYSEPVRAGLANLACDAQKVLDDDETCFAEDSGMCYWREEHQRLVNALMPLAGVAEGE